MAKINIPFAASADVTLVNNAQTDSGSFSAIGANAAMTVVARTCPSGCGNSNVRFDVTAVSGFDVGAGTVAGHEPYRQSIIFFWEFGDPGAVFDFTMPGLEKWNDRNTGFGSITDHWYEGHGTFTVKCWAYELNSNKRAYQEVSVTLTDEETVYGGANTLYIAPDGDFSNAPAGNSGTFTDFHTAFTTRGNADHTRYMFKAGTSTTETATRTYNYNLGNQVRLTSRLVVDNPANGNHTWVADPTHSGIFMHRWSQGRVSDGDVQRESELQYRNQDFTGNYNIRGVAENDPAPGNSVLTCIGTFSGHIFMRHMSFHRCNWSGGWSHCVSDSGSQYNSDPLNMIAVSNCTMTEWRDMALWFGGTNSFAVVGVQGVQRLDADCGGPKNNKYHSHGFLRHNSSVKSFGNVDYVDAFTKGGWTTNVVPNKFVQQPCFRFNQAPALGSVLVGYRCSLEGGDQIIKISRMSNANAQLEPIMALPFNASFSNILGKGGSMSSALFGVDSGDLLARNCVFTTSDGGRLSYNPVAIVSASDTNGGTDSASLPIRVMFSTIHSDLALANYSTGTPAALTVITAPAEFTTTEATDNLISDAGRSALSHNVTGSINGPDRRHTGYQAHMDAIDAAGAWAAFHFPTLDANTIYAGSASVIPAPQTGSNAESTTGTYNPQFDFFGGVRSLSSDAVGAVRTTRP